MPPKEDSSTVYGIDAAIQTTTMEAATKRTQLSDIAMAKSSPPMNEKDLWWIHGNGYDLRGLMERHPGGKEAILLGKGRDCTALVESYHAFSPHHRKVLEKYLCHQEQNPPPPDLFYDVLKQRSAAALRAKGIDPVKDRGAGWLRMTYYIIIIVFVLATGYWHVKVSDQGRNEFNFLDKFDFPQSHLDPSFAHTTGTIIRGVYWVHLPLLYLVGYWEVLAMMRAILQPVINIPKSMNGECGPCR